MKVKDMKLYHGLTGNDASPAVTGWTRGAVVSAIVALTNMVILLVPIAAATQAVILTGVIPAVVLFSFVLFGYLDKKFSKYLGDKNGYS